MRNCFIYQCDRRHKDGPKRAMFNIPKDPEKFELWRQALPKHRPLKPHDRVCEKHFKPSDILRDWTYQIEGKTKRLMRAKPILRPDAVPSCTGTGNRSSDEVPVRRRRSQRAIPETCANVVEEIQRAEGGTEHGVEHKPDVVDGGEMDPHGREAIFEKLYDNIYDVGLPSTLWGVHREPDRKFVAFSRYEWCQGMDEAIPKTTSLLIDCTLRCRAWSGGKLVLEDDLCQKLAPPSVGDDKTTRFQIIVDLLDKLERRLDKRLATKRKHESSVEATENASPL